MSILELPCAQSCHGPTSLASVRVKQCLSGPLQSYMSQPPSGSEPLRSNVVPYGEVHSTPEVMTDISATPSEKMTNPITDSSGDPVTLDDNLGLRPRARAVSGLRPSARAIFGSAPCLASVQGRLSNVNYSLLVPPSALPAQASRSTIQPRRLQHRSWGGRLNSDACATLHTLHTTHTCTSTAHPAPCPQCQYSSFLVLNLVTVLRPLRACA